MRYLAFLCNYFVTKSPKRKVTKLQAKRGYCRAESEIFKKVPLKKLQSYNE